MEHKIINTETYLLIVDDSEIKEGDFFMTDDNRIELYAPDWRAREWHKKIIAHLPLNNSPILEGVILLPPLEDEVEIPMRNQTIDYSYGYRQGYNKAKEKYKYTEEDLMKAIDMAREYNPDVVGFTKNEIIQSLNQPKMPVKFVCEMKKDYRKNDDGEPIGLPVHETNKPKTTTNSQGIIQWVGEYIY
jgi:hypothetical protein